MYVLLTNSNSLWSICSESVALCWPRVEHYSGGLTLYTADGGRPSSLCSGGELRVWLKQLTLTPQPTHLFHPVAVLEFHSFLSHHLLVVWEQLSTRLTEPKKWHVVQRKCLPCFFFFYNEKFKFNHRHVMDTIVNCPGSFFLYLFVFWWSGICIPSEPSLTQTRKIKRTQSSQLKKKKKEKKTGKRNE